MFGPRTRISSLSPLGTSFISTPGAGRPTLPARSSRKCAAVASGAVSVVPHDDDIGTRWPVTRTDTASSRSHKILRQRGARIEDQPQIREEGARESLVAFEMRQQRRVAGRHVEIDRRRDFGEVAHGLADHRGQRPAAVDHQRAGVAQHHVEVVIAAEGVIPRQPVDQRERLLGEERPASAAPAAGSRSACRGC